MQIIPLSKIPAQTFHVVLDDQNCTIMLYWRQTHLYMDLSVGSIEIFKGAICQNRADVKQSPTPNFSGTLHFFDSEGDTAPQWSGLYNGTSGRWCLFYIPDGEEIPEGLSY